MSLGTLLSGMLGRLLAASETFSDGYLCKNTVANRVTVFDWRVILGCDINCGTPCTYIVRPRVLVL